MNDTLTVIFDGRCRVCAWTIRTLGNLDRHHRLTMVPCQGIEGVERFGLTRERCDRQVFVARSDGTLIEGGQAAMLILATALEQPWLARVAALPVVRQVVTPGICCSRRCGGACPARPTWCDEHPGQCIQA